jgi:hypothetical protein
MVSIWACAVGLVDYGEDDDEGDEGDSISGSVSTSPRAAAASNMQRQALQPTSLSIFQPAGPSTGRGGRSRGPGGALRFSATISARGIGDTAEAPAGKEDTVVQHGGEGSSPQGSLEVSATATAPAAGTVTTAAGAGLQVVVVGDGDAAEGSDVAAATAGPLTPSKRRAGDGEGPEGGSKGRKAAKVDSEESTHTSSLVE